MLSSSIALVLPALLILGRSIVAFPVNTEERAVRCEKDDYGPFLLYAAPADESSDEWQRVKLVDLYTPHPTNDTIQALSVRFPI